MIGQGSLAVNNLLVPAPMSGAFFPNGGMAPFYHGNGQGPSTLPIMGSSGGTDAQASIAAAAPFDPIHSPLLWAIAFLVIGVFGLRYVHWRG